MALSTPTGKLYLSLLVISSGKTDFERDAAALQLTAPEQSRVYFERCYETAYQFVFNEFVTNRIEHQYLGHRVDESGVESLGKVRTDFVLQQNDFFETHSLHVHVCFENASFDIADPDSFDLPAIAQFARGLYRQHEADVEALPDALRTFVRAMDKYAKRRQAYDISKYLYISVCGQTLPAGGWRDVALPNPHASLVPAPGGCRGRCGHLPGKRVPGVPATSSGTSISREGWSRFRRRTLGSPTWANSTTSSRHSSRSRDGTQDDPRLADYDGLPEYPPSALPRASRP